METTDHRLDHYEREINRIFDELRVTCLQVGFGADYCEQSREKALEPVSERRTLVQRLAIVTPCGRIYP